MNDKVNDQFVDITTNMTLSASIAAHGEIDKKGRRLKSQTTTLSIGDIVGERWNGSIVDSFYVDQSE